MKNNEASVGGAIVFKEDKKGKKSFLIVKTKENADWEIPKVNVRRGESSVRAVIRFTSEQAGITPRVLEEAGRFNSTITVGPKIIHQKYYYYIMIEKAGGGEVLGFHEHEWVEFPKACKKV